MRVSRWGVWTGLVVLAVLGAGCGSRGMRTVSQTTVAPPGPNEAVVVFMRPLLGGDTYSTSVFDLRPDGDRFVGILRSQTRLAYRTTPGRTRFMLIATGGRDQFMDAELAGGKTYFATVTYEAVGNVTAYVLKPVRGAGPDSKEFTSCQAQCAWVENTERSEAWGRNRLRELPQRKARYLPEWEALGPRPALTAADGR
jgi:hypothetical protein